MRQCARGWCTGMAQRDGTGREVGGGIQDGEQMYTRGGFMSSMAKTIAALSSNQPPIKINKILKNKLNSFAKKGLINVGFVTSKNTIIFVPFFPPSSPFCLSFSFLLYN